MRSYKAYSILTCLLALTGYAHAGGKLPPQFTLGRYVPADAWMLVHAVDNPERHWIEERWMGVVQTVIDSGIGEDVKNLIFPMIPADRREEVRGHFDRLEQSIRSVKWGEMTRHEFVFAERLSQSGLAYDYVALMRGERETADQNFKALGDILKHVTGLSDKAGVQAYDVDGIDVMVAGARKPGAEKITQPVMWLIHKDDIIGLSITPPVGEHSKAIMDDILGMMSGKKPGPSIIESPRFREALSRVESPNDTICFYDLKTMFGNLHNMFETIGRQVESQAPKGPDGDQKKAHERKMVGAVAALIDQGSFIDYVVTSQSTKGIRSNTDEYTHYRPGWKDRPLSKAFLDRKPFERFDQYIPKNAASFSLGSGADLELVYDFALDFVEKNVPSGDRVKSRLDSVFQELGFDPKRDLFSWLSGETIEISLPAAVVTPMGGSSDWVTMIRVKNPEVASCRVNDAIDWVNKKLQQRGQMLMVSPANCKVGSFREVTHPMLAMVMRPVIGVQDDWLVIAKSADAVNKCMSVAQGDAPSILKNERFREEGLIPDGPVQSLSFEDLSRRGDEWSGAAAAVGMFGGMAAGMMPPDVPQEARALVTSVTGIVAKLAPALKQIDFYSSKSAMGVMEGDSGYRKRTVVTYKAPNASKEKVAGEPR